MNKLRLFSHPFTWGIITLVTLLLSLTPWVYPGEAVTLMAHLAGVWHASSGIVTAHPLFSLLFGALGNLLPASIVVPVFNLSSAILGALCVTLLCQIIRLTVHYLADEPRTVPSVSRAANLAVPVAGLTLLLSPDFLRAATHFQWQIFDLFLLLGALFLLCRVACKPTRLLLTLTAFAWGLLTFESVELLLFTPFFVLLLATAYYADQDELSSRPFILNLAFPLLFGFVLTFTTVLLQLFALEPSTDLRAAILIQGYARFATLLSYFNGPWILVLLTGIIPAVLTFFLLKDAGKNKRTATLFFTFLTAVVLSILAILPFKLSIPTLTANWTDAYPLFPAMFTAFAFAGLTAIGVLFFTVKHPPEAANESFFARPLCKIAGWCCVIVLPIALIVSAIMVTVPTRIEEARFSKLPQAYTDAVLANAENKETWLLADGAADAYLALRIAQCQSPVILFSLTQNRDAGALNALREKLQASAYFADKAELRETLSRALDLGLIPFIQDWLRADEGAEKVFATMGLPDLWYTGNRLPLPQGLWYRGASTREAQHLQLNQAMPETLALKHETPAEQTFSAVKGFANYVLRQESFILNNTAFYLADAGKLEEAYQLFTDVYTAHPDNISALFNLFELINGGLHPEAKEWCEKELTERIRKLRGRKYQLWALARTYGYIRSPQVISMLAGSWAMSGQTGAALSGMDLALAMLDDGKKVVFDQMIAEFYKVDPSKRNEAIKKYQQMLSNSTDRRQSLVYVRELVRMNILENDLQAAKQTLEQVDPTGDSTDLSYERALWFSAAGQPDRSRVELERCLADNPRHLEALAMLATLQLQKGELATLTAETLPKLKTAAGTEDNYFVQIISAQLAEKDNQLPKARAAYLRALALKPEVHALRNTVLTLDIRMNDKAAAAQHAKDFLYHDRKLPLANYIMGSLALGDGDPKRALSYLSLATAPDVNPPLPEAFNDLAEAQRQLGDWPAALAAAEHACKLSPNLAIARETAAAALLELGRYAEAHQYLEAAFDLEKQRNANQAPDPRLLITRARLHEKEGHPDLARVDLAAARSAYGTLDRKAKLEFDELAKKVNLQ